MKYQAVIFDLFGTLVDIFSRREYDRVLSEMAAALAIPTSEFSQAWISGGDARTLGTVISPIGSLLEVCGTLRYTPTQEQLELASQARLDYYRRNLKLRPDAEEVLTELKQRGRLVGLISNCATEILASWQDSPLSRLVESPVFSCSVGLKKPDPRIYEMAASALGGETASLPLCRGRRQRRIAGSHRHGYACRQNTRAVRSHGRLASCQRRELARDND